MQLDQATTNKLLSRAEYRTLKKAKMKKAKVSKLKKDVSGVVLATAILTTATSTSASSIKTYTVNQNDTLYKLSQEYGVSVEYLQQINGKTDNQLLIGEKILIPQIIEKTEAYTERVVKAGDTWYQFSKEVNVPVNELLQLNNKQSDVLAVNETILLPSVLSETVAPAAEPIKVVGQAIKVKEKQTVEATVIVENGDTLWKIAREYRTTVDEIRAANNLKNNRIKAGQELVIGDITKAEAIIVGSVDSNFIEFKLPTRESVVLKVTPFHNVDQFANRTGIQATIQYNDETNELISYSVK